MIWRIGWQFSSRVSYGFYNEGIMAKPGTSYISVTDQFCGAGGSSLGASAAGTEVVLAMNHWELAIETHNTNFPQTLNL